MLWNRKSFVARQVKNWRRCNGFHTMRPESKVHRMCHIRTALGHASRKKWKRRRAELASAWIPRLLWTHRKDSPSTSNIWSDPDFKSIVSFSELIVRYIVSIYTRSIHSHTLATLFSSKNTVKHTRTSTSAFNIPTSIAIFVHDENNNNEN